MAWPWLLAPLGPAGASRDCRDGTSLHLDDAPARRGDKVRFANFDLARRQLAEGQLARNMANSIWPYFGKLIKNKLPAKLHTCSL